MRRRVTGALLVMLLAACSRTSTPAPDVDEPRRAASPRTSVAPIAPIAPLVREARRQIGVTVRYDPAYAVLAYPNGDVPIDRGVCTDVVIRAFRPLGLDLQAAVHEDMRTHFEAYPRLWGLRAPDRNIDHRRVPNLQRWFEREGWSMPITNDGGDYRAGDVVTWRLPTGVPHIGIVSDRRYAGRPLVIHNIGWGTREDDGLFAYTLTGHYRPREPLPR